MVYDYYKERDKKVNIDKIKRRLTFLIIFLLLIAGLIGVANVYTEIIELKEIGDYESVYITNLAYNIAFFVIVFIFIAVVFSVTGIFIKRNLNAYFREKKLKPQKLPNVLITLPIALIGALITNDIFTQKALNFLNSTKFNKNDPLFSKDIGYYIFQRPLWMAIYDFIFILWLFVIIYTLVYYIIVLATLYKSITFQDLKVKSIIRHNLINVAILFIIKSVSYKFMKESVLYSTVLDVKGAGYVDVKIWLNYFRLAPILLVIIVVLSFMFISIEKFKRAAITISVFPAIWIVVTLTAVIVQSFVVKPNEANLESQYLKYNIQQTRQAYNLSTIKVENFSEIQPLTPEIIQKNQETKNNIRVIDYQPTLQYTIQQQRNTNFYTFYDCDIINYTINGKNMPVFISAREIDKNQLPEKSYINTTFKYTHGYGVVINPINSITDKGGVNYILSGLKMNSVDPNLKINQPRIYYGELTKDPVIVNAGQNLKEIDYDGTTESETIYGGKGGIKLSLLNRIIYSFKLADFNMIISNYVKSDSKLLLNRNIIGRAKKAVPFLTVDDDPYILITSDGKLKWVLDAYTTSNAYPYSQSVSFFGKEINYVRNSVKIVIDAYDGSVKYYIIDKTDPIIQTYAKIYPGLFADEELPADISEHMKYPESLFKIQTNILKRYHLDPDKDSDAVTSFYTNQDLWDIAKHPVYSDMDSIINSDVTDQSNLKEIEPYYNMIKMPNDPNGTVELILMRPFTPSKSDNMVSWLAVRNSAQNYGEMVLYVFPKNTNIFGPNQIEVKINQIDEVRTNMTLWSQGTSSVFKGSLLVIPIENSILYVEPVYIKSGTSSTPEVRMIIVGYQKGDDFIYGTGTNLDSALNNLFAAGHVVTPEDTPELMEPEEEEKGEDSSRKGTKKNANVTTADKETIEEIIEKYDDIKKQIDELGKLIDELKKGNKDDE